MKRYVAVLFSGSRWGVGLLHDTEPPWVEVRRSNLSLADASDLRDAWNTRGSEDQK